MSDNPPDLSTLPGMLDALVHQVPGWESRMFNGMLRQGIVYNQDGDPNKKFFRAVFDTQENAAQFASAIYAVTGVRKAPEETITTGATQWRVRFDHAESVALYEALQRVQAPDSVNAALDAVFNTLVDERILGAHDLERGDAEHTRARFAGSPPALFLAPNRGGAAENLRTTFMHTFGIDLESARPTGWDGPVVIRVREEDVTTLLQLENRLKQGTGIAKRLYNDIELEETYGLGETRMTVYRQSPAVEFNRPNPVPARFAGSIPAYDAAVSAYLLEHYGATPDADALKEGRFVIAASQFDAMSARITAWDAQQNIINQIRHAPSNNRKAALNAFAFAAAEDPQRCDKELAKLNAYMQDGAATKPYMLWLNFNGRFLNAADTAESYPLNREDVAQIIALVTEHRSIFAGYGRELSGKSNVFLRPDEPPKPAAPPPKPVMPWDPKPGDIDERREFGGFTVEVSERLGTNPDRPIQEDAFLMAHTPLGPDANVRAAAQTAFAEAQAATQSGPDGSTGTVAVITPDRKMTLAYLGDSPVLVFTRNPHTGEVRAHGFITGPDGPAPYHHPNAPEEAKRIGVLYDADHPDTPMGTYQLGVLYNNARGRLAVSGAFGDPSFKYIRREPQVVEVDLNGLAPNGEEIYVCSGCDGLFDSSRNTLQDYRDIIAAGPSADGKSLAQRFKEKALEHGSGDNVTALITKLPEKMDHALVMGVCDGHGGKQTSTAAARILEHSLLRELGKGLEKSPETPSVALAEAPPSIIPHPGALRPVGLSQRIDPPGQSL